MNLNKSKSSENPFRWIERAKVKFHIAEEDWNKVVSYIAEQHKMSTTEFESRVNECCKKISIKRHFKKLNKVFATATEIRRKPYPQVRHILGEGVIFEVALERYGTKKTKNFFESAEGKEMIKDIKVMMAR
ncbi:hypothetical protein ACQCVK_22255 [Rossellomorea vietnamensis]|uniref:hypothetical protein n=1 Tax=Rossellomorea vietnamensis TaxID=218284 RepID=UPI003CF65C19